MSKNYRERFRIQDVRNDLDTQTFFLDHALEDEIKPGQFLMVNVNKGKKKMH